MSALLDFAIVGGIFLWFGIVIYLKLSKRNFNEVVKQVIEFIKGSMK